jgi:hypothetical protein
LNRNAASFLKRLDNSGWRRAIKCNSFDAKAMNKLFISHSSQDDAFVRELRAALADHEQQGWIDSRDLRGGDPL